MSGPDLIIETDEEEFEPDSNLSGGANEFELKMVEALESERGIAIGCESKEQAQSLRFKFYNERNKHNNAGITLFDKLTFKIIDEGGEVELQILKSIMPKTVRKL